MQQTSVSVNYIPKTLPKFLAHFLKPQMGWFLALVIVPMFAWALSQNGMPYCMKMLIDVVADFKGDRSNIFSIVSSILLIWFSIWMWETVSWRFMDFVQIKFIPSFQANIRLHMLQYVEQHSYKYFADEFAGSISNKISDMVNHSWDLLDFICYQFMPVCFSIFFSVVMLSFVQPVFALIIAIYFFVHMAITLCLSKQCGDLSDYHSHLKSTLQGNIVDSLTNIVNVRLFSNQRYESSYITQVQKPEVEAHRKLLGSLLKVRVLLEIPATVMICTTVYYLIDSWKNHLITTGDFALVLNLSFGLMMSVWHLGFQTPSFFKNWGTCKQALGVILPPHGIVDAKDAAPLVVTQGKIEFDRVHFHYSLEQDLFKDKSIVIQPGEKIGLVGYSGSGKSTFAHLILRYFDIEQGRILIDGQDISQVTQESLRKNIAFIPQDVSLFHRTLMENIRYGRLDASDDEVKTAATRAHCHEFITKLPEGYQTLVGERGIKLSGGQRQRIAIARAVLKNAPVLILDEATSALDSVTENEIQDSLAHLMAHKTTIVIAHRLSTLLGMDRLLVFDKGQIVEMGHHQQLLDTKGIYYKLWMSQSGGFLQDAAPI